MKLKATYGSLLLMLAIISFWGCNKELPIDPKADFTTSLVNNTAYAGETFVVYLKDVAGDNMVYFTGETPATSYENYPQVKGASIKAGLDNVPDSILVIYNSTGTYTFTLVATSYGNWSKASKIATKSVTISVIDRRAGLDKFTIDKIDGQLSQDGTEIYFYASKAVDLTKKKPVFTTTSENDTVYVNGIVQTSNTTVQDFSAITPGDNEGRHVVYTVKAPNGATRTYTVYYILRDPYTDKQLISLNVQILSTDFIPDEAAKSIEILYLTGTSLTKAKVQATVSLGAVALIGTTNISDKQVTVNLETATKITVKAEDGSTQDYTIVRTPIDKIATFSFTMASGVTLNPAPVGKIDYVKKTISISVLNGTDVTQLVATFTGLTTFTAQVGATVLTSGVTPVDYTAPVVIDLYLGARKLDSYTVTVTKVSK